MYSALRELLRDHTGGAPFTCFGAFHLCFIVAVFVSVAAVFFRIGRKRTGGGSDSGMRDGRRRAYEKAARVCIDLAFGLYVLDFFLMPFAYGEIDIEKLPFHVCTATCVMCFLSVRTRALREWRIPFALLGFLSNLVYLLYPAGVMWYAVRPLTYRVIQTLLFHGVMAAYGAFALAWADSELSWRNWPRNLAAIGGMTLWALLGNTLYNGTAAEGTRFYNWFFVVRDPFGAVDPAVSPYLMPFLNTAVFFAAECLVLALFNAFRRRSAGEKESDR